MGSDREIEIKIQIDDRRQLIAFLKKYGKFIAEERQVDDYYVPIERDFRKVRPIKEWLRLRTADGKYSINYKNWHFLKNGKSEYCDEYESPIGDLDQLEKIFKMLKIKKIVTVDKVRRIWRYKEYEVSIDTIKGLGDFVEIEYKGRSKLKPKTITDQMVEFLKQFKPGKIARNYLGYPHQLMFPKEKEIEIL